MKDGFIERQQVTRKEVAWETSGGLAEDGAMLSNRTFCSGGNVLHLRCYSGRWPYMAINHLKRS